MPTTSGSSSNKRKETASIASFFVKKQATDKQRGEVADHSSSNCESRDSNRNAVSLTQIIVLEETEPSEPAAIVISNSNTNINSSVGKKPNKAVPVHPLFLPKEKPSPIDVVEPVSPPFELIEATNEEANAELDEEKLVEESNRLNIDFDLDTEPEEAEVAAQSSKQSIGNSVISDRPRRQAAVDAAQRQEKQREAAISLDHALRTRGRLKPDSNVKKRKSEAIDEVDEEDDFVAVPGIDKKKETKSTASIFLTKEEKARRKAEDLEQARIRQLQEQEAERLRKISEQEARIRQQFKDDLERKERERQNFGSGVNPFFQQQFVSRNPSTSTSCSEGEGPMCEEIRFSKFQHVGLPNVASWCRSMTVSASATQERCSIGIDDRYLQLVDFLSLQPLYSEIDLNSSFEMKSLFVYYLASMLDQYPRQRVKKQKSANNMVEICGEEEDGDEESCTLIECVDLTAPVKRDQSLVVIDELEMCSSGQQSGGTNLHGASRDRACIKKISRWMEIWAGKRKRKIKRKSSKNSLRSGRTAENMNDVLLSAGLPNVLHVIGPSGAGKTAAIYTCAKAAGFNVIEINPSMDRKSSAIKQLVSEAFQSYGLATGWVDSDAHSGAESFGTQCLNLILFDEVDITFEDESNFHATVVQLSRNFKCPIVFTSESHLHFVRQLQPYVVKFIPGFGSELSARLLDDFCEVNETFAIRLQREADTDGGKKLMLQIVTKLLQAMESYFQGDARACKLALQLCRFEEKAASLDQLRAYLDNLKSFEFWLASKYSFASVSYLYSLHNTVQKVSNFVDVSNEHLNMMTEFQIAAPVIHRIEPRTIHLKYHDKFTVFGVNFLQCLDNGDNAPLQCAVSIAGIPIECSVISDTQIECMLPKDNVFRGDCLVTVQICYRSHKLVSSELCGIGNSYVGFNDEEWQVPVELLRERQLAVAAILIPLLEPSSLSAELSQLIDSRCSVSPVDDGDFYNPSAHTRKLAKKASKTGKSSEKLQLMIEVVPVVTGDPVIATDNETETTAQKAAAICSDMPFTKQLMQIALVSIGRLILDSRSYHFLQPVSPSDYPNYAKVVDMPSDVETILLKLRSGKYQVSGDFDIPQIVEDIRLICRNCIKFNGLESALSCCARELVGNFEDSIISGFRDLNAAAADEFPDLVVDDSCVCIGGKLIIKKMNLETNESERMCVCPIDSEQSLTAVHDKRRASRDAVVANERAWRNRFSSCGLEYQASSDQSETAWLYPQPIDGGAMSGQCQALDDYLLMLEVYGDADVLQSKVALLSRRDGDANSDIIREFCEFPKLHANSAEIRASITNLIDYKISTRTSELQSADTGRAEGAESYLRAMEALSEYFKPSSSNPSIIVEEQDSIVNARQTQTTTETELNSGESEEWDESADVSCNRRQLSMLNQFETESIDSFDSDDSDSDEEELEKITAQVLNDSTPSPEGNYTRMMQLKRDVSEFENFINSLVFEDSPFQNLPLYKNCLSLHYLLDLIPLIGRMAQNECFNDKSKALGICASLSDIHATSRSRRVTRGNTSASMRYRWLTNSTLLSVDQIEKFLKFGFIGARSVVHPRTIVNIDSVSWI